MITPFDTCSVCPRLCRDVCPVATVHEAGAPSFIGRVLRDHALGRGVLDDEAQHVATLCTDCGRCEDACHVGVPFLELIRQVRTLPLALPIEVTGDAVDVVVVETDERPLAALVAKRAGRSVGRWRTYDQCGVKALGTPAFSAHAERLRQRLGTATAVVADGGAMQALTAAGVAAVWADTFVGEGSQRVASCARGKPSGTACCGGAGPLSQAHPAVAVAVAERFAERQDAQTKALDCSDARCRNHLRASGIPAVDFIDAWLSEDA